LDFLIGTAGLQFTSAREAVRIQVREAMLLFDATRRFQSAPNTIILTSELLRRA